MYKLAIWYIGKCNTKWNRPINELNTLSRLMYRSGNKAYLLYGADSEWRKGRFMKLKSKKIAENIYFDNFVVVKESKNFFGVYQKWSKYWNTYNHNMLITSGNTLQQACKKAKLLQIGYDLARDDLIKIEM